MILRIEYVLLILLLIFTLSFNNHQLWLLYDLLIITLIFKNLAQNKIKINLFFFILSTLLFFLFIYSLFSFQNILYQILNFWDVYKHLFLISYIANSNNLRKLLYFNKIFKPVIFILLVLQFLLVIYQYSTGLHWDLINGSFGNGNQHTLGFFTILSLVIFFNKTFFYLFILLLCFFINLLSENIVFLILIFLYSIYYFLFLDKKTLFRFVKPFLYILFLFLITININLNFNNEIFEIVKNRLINLFYSFNDPSMYDTITQYSRIALLLFIMKNFNFLGYGSGYSNDIYTLESPFHPSSNFLFDTNLSQAISIYIDFGFIGYLLTLSIYLLALSKLNFKSSYWKYSFFTIFFLIFHYSLILTNESQFFIFLLILTLLSTYDKNNKYL